MISINVNNVIKKVAVATTLQQLLGQLQQSESGIAVAINNTVISKSDWSTCKLLANDNVLIITATQGG